jgi:hypothetical protein
MKTLLPLTLILLSGCASIIDGRQQPITIQTTPVKAAECTLTNSNGTWNVNSTPGQVVVNRAYGDLSITCNKDNYTGLTVAESRVKGWFWGNILFGGLIGMGIDSFNGAGFDYPQNITVPLHTK